MPVRRRSLVTAGDAAAALIAVAAMIGCSKTTPDGVITVAAASSLRAAMPELARVYEASHPGRRVSAMYAASGDLRRQVEAGAPIDVVLFAGARPVDELVAEGRAVGESRRVVARNELVLVGPKGKSPLTFATLTELPPDDKVAVGDPRTVPAGEYARDYLTALGEWDALQSHLVTGPNVAAVLVYVRRGEVAAGVVYRTELRGIDDLIVLDEARGKDAPHPEVVGAVVRGGSADAADFLKFVESSAGERVLESFGFGAP
jgi:molybdate transport system substrate-binding protein